MGTFTWAGQSSLGPKYHASKPMVGRMGGGLHFLVEIELEMAKMPAFTNLKVINNWMFKKYSLLVVQALPFEPP